MNWFSRKITSSEVLIMKKLLGIVVLGLLWCNVVNAKEVFYLRCIPEVKVVRAGDFKEGDIFVQFLDLKSILPSEYEAA